MEMEATDFLVKVSPFVWTWWRQRYRVPMKCLFVIIGKGDVTYRGLDGKGISGDGIIVGGEIAGITRYFSGCIGATYQQVKFDPGQIAGTNLPFDIDASRVLVYARIGIGFGM